MDVFERVLYNGLLSGVALSGDRFFYQNPLESAGGYGRSPWFEVACCPPNMTRFLPSLPGYVYATKDDTVFVNLFIGGTGKIPIPGRPVIVTQETRYPWDGTVELILSLGGPGALRARPAHPRLGPGRGHADGPLQVPRRPRRKRPGLKVNGEAVTLDIRDGYARIRRDWKDCDTVELTLPMPVRRVVANEAVAEDRGRVGAPARPDRLRGRGGRQRRPGLRPRPARPGRAWPSNSGPTCSTASRSSRDRPSRSPRTRPGRPSRPRAPSWPSRITPGPTAAPARCWSGCPARPPRSDLPKK